MVVVSPVSEGQKGKLICKGNARQNVVPTCFGNVFVGNGAAFSLLCHKLRHYHGSTSRTNRPAARTPRFAARPIAARGWAGCPMVAFAVCWKMFSKVLAFLCAVSSTRYNFGNFCHEGGHQVPTKLFCHWYKILFDQRHSCSDDSHGKCTHTARSALPCWSPKQGCIGGGFNCI